MSDGDWDRAGELLALGHHHRALLRLPSPGEEDVYPRFAVSAQGCAFVDAAGRTYLDWMNGWGPVLLGYRHPKVEAAIRAQLEAGPTLSILHRVELDVAELLVEMIPCAEMVAFGKNGSDAVTAAVRIARAHTGREVILHHGFHGFHDWYVCGYPEVPGVPKATAPLLHPFPYNDLDALDALFRRFDGRVAAVVMEPVNVRLPDPGFLEAVRDLAHRHGALLVFDEMVTGFRLARGGAQEFFDVVPDLACFGKAIGNGMPLSAVVGGRRHMRLLPKVGWGMTFSSETLSLAAARATLEVLRDEPVIAHLARVGREVREGFHRACANEGVRCSLMGPDARMSFEFADQGGFGGDVLRTLFLRECARNGVLTNGTLLPSYAHDGDAVRRTLVALAAALAVVAGAIHGRASGIPPLFLAKGFVDSLAEQGEGVLAVSGWLLVDDACAERIEIVAPSGATRHAEPIDRPDVAAVHPFARGGDRSGFAARLPADEFVGGALWEFEIRGIRGGNVVFRCPVEMQARGAHAASGPFDLSSGRIIA